jgi:hypothetical protein
MMVAHGTEGGEGSAQNGLSPVLVPSLSVFRSSKASWLRLVRGLPHFSFRLKVFLKKPSPLSGELVGSPDQAGGGALFSSFRFWSGDSSKRSTRMWPSPTSPLRRLKGMCFLPFALTDSLPRRISRSKRLRAASAPTFSRRGPRPYRQRPPARPAPGRVPWRPQSETCGHLGRPSVFGPCSTPRSHVSG